MNSDPRFARLSEFGGLRPGQALNLAHDLSTAARAFTSAPGYCGFVALPSDQDSHVTAITFWRSREAAAVLAPALTELREQIASDHDATLSLSLRDVVGWHLPARAR